VIGFDISFIRIDELKQGFERTNEVEAKDLAFADILFTCDAGDLK
jgi:UDP-N-acetyl-D-galactosamine dehydrogenase